jgi:TolB-like protein/Flp pilus assembly protein TadD
MDLPLPDPPAEKRLRFGPFDARPDAGELLREGRGVPIQQQPFKLLVFLLEQPGRTFSREELYERLWPTGTFVDFEHGLNTVVRKLRSALRDGPEAPEYVETVPGRGYRFTGVVEALSAPTRDAMATGAVEHSVRPCREVSTVLVAPFVPHDPAENDRSLAMGVREDLFTLLDSLSGFSVIARHLGSVGDDIACPLEAGRAANARYVVTGSVGRRDAGIRLHVRLLRVEDGVQIWAQRFDRDITRLFAVEDEIADAVARALGTWLFVAEVERARSMRPEDLDAWQLVQQAIASESVAYGRENVFVAEALLRRAIEIEPDYALALASLAIVLAGRARSGLSADTRRDQAEARELADHARAGAPIDPRVLYRIGGTYLRLGDAAGSLPFLEQAVEHDRTWPGARVDLGLALMQTGREEAAIPFLREAARSDRRDPFHYLHSLALGTALFVKGEIREAETALRRSVSLYPYHLNWLALSLLLASEGRVYEARDALKNARDIEPSLTRKRCEDIVRSFIRDPSTANALVESMSGVWFMVDAQH